MKIRSADKIEYPCSIHIGLQKPDFCDKGLVKAKENEEKKQRNDIFTIFFFVFWLIFDWFKKILIDFGKV